MIENTNTKQFYPGPILNTTLEITDFLFNDAEQIKVKHSKFNKENILVDVDLNYGTDYEVTKVLPSDINAAEAALTASTGQVLLKNVNVLAGEKLTVYRVSQIIQDMDYPRTGSFPAASHEGALDYLTMQNQEQQEQIDRSLKIPNSVETFDAQMPTPLPARALKINADGTGFEMSEFDPDIALTTTEEFKNQAQQAAIEALASQNIATGQATTATEQANIATEQANIATEQANIATAQATIAINKTSEVVASGNEALSNITTAKNSAISTITTQETTSKNNVIATGNAQVDRVIATGNNYDNLTYKNITNCILKAPNGVAQWSGVTPTGTLVNNQGVVSGFSESNYGLIDKTPPSNITSYEFMATFTTGAQQDEQQGIFANSYTNRATVQMIVNDNYLYIQQPEDASTWISVQTTTPLLANTTYQAKGIWDGSNLSLYYKTNEENEFTFVGTTPVSTIYWVEPIGVGCDRLGAFPFSGSIDLSQSYIKINGKMWWQGNDLGFNQFRVKEGLKTLIPNGRNENGTLRNIENTLSQDLTYTFEDNATGSYWAGVGENAVRLRKTSWEYKNDENYIIGTLENGNLGQKALGTMIGDMEVKNGNITSLAPYNPVALVSWDDESYKKSVYGYILPDYTAAIDMGLTASSPYTAPCDGWVIGTFGISGSGNHYIKVNDVSVYQEPDDYVSVAMPVKAKDIVSSTSTPYNREGNIKFYPCKGAYNV